MSTLLQAFNSIKQTNPKDNVGATKPPASTVSRAVMAAVRSHLQVPIPRLVIWQVAMGMEEGARKYGKHNYRVAGVRASIYFDATYRHLDKWMMGENIDPDSNLNHIVKAICSLTVVADASINKMLNDDRPPKSLHQFTPSKLQIGGRLDAVTSINSIQNTLDMWWEGAAGNSLLFEAIAQLLVLADHILRDEFIDDRPLPAPPEWMDDLQTSMNDLIKKFPNPVAPFTEIPA